MKNEMPTGFGHPPSRNVQGAPGVVRGKEADAFQNIKTGEAVEMAQSPPLFRYMIPQKRGPFKTDLSGPPSKSRAGSPEIFLIP